MFHPLSVSIGLRYTRAKRRNQFISFISLSSMIGVAVGVLALIIILSVMNGFEKELRARILGMASHASVQAVDGTLQDWRPLLEKLRRQPHVVGAAPYIRTEAMATYGGYVNGVVVQGVDPALEGQVSIIGQKMIEGRLEALEPGRFGVVLGGALARSLRANVGDKVMIISPQPVATAAGNIPRSKRFTVVGVFEVGAQEYDTTLAVIHIEDAARLFRYGSGVTGIRLQFDDLFDAPRIGGQIGKALGGAYAVKDWTKEHVTFFQALKTEKVMMFVILMLIVAVAAFNIVSTLVMVVTDKQADIAILRTLGLSPRSVMGVFVVQGAVIGVVGTLIGGAAGVWLATHLREFIRWLEQGLHFKFLDCRTYYICEVPSDMHWSDVTVVTALSVLLTLVATIYPALRAARTQPAEALRYE
ncbi:MAG: Lipoprotein-releasing system transmembrane protein LolE [Gammaproteobacteria bacterium]|nr:Lipoprotein-releasing system transmembrane protein LolE [Gammaproteobacteria bacterium]